jgi:glycosyltransferase involved in cell wall biosynthesis
LPLARILDLTRLVSRLGRGPLTGVDRVELAYLDHLRAARDGAPLFALVRLRTGFALLDAAGAEHIAALARGAALPERAMLRARLANRDPLRARAETAVRAVAIAFALPPLLPRLLGCLPRGGCYYNTGHANLTPPLFAAMTRAGLRSSVLLHDVIPLDHPEYTRPGIPEVFGRKLAAIAAGADRVIHTSHSTRQANEAQLARCGRVPSGIVAPLGVPPVPPEPYHLAGLDPARPWFLCVGTIEPRKNHALLLDVWEMLDRELPASAMPQLVIAGGRGWRNEAVFRRLDTRPPHVLEIAGLPDGAVAGLMTGARALLFPTLAEGFGLPPVEAMALDTPAVVSDLPVLREVLGDYPVYLDKSDVYSWKETVKRLSASDLKGWRRGGAEKKTRIPDWAAHFNSVLRDGW